MTGRKFFLLQGIGMIKFANSCFGSRSVCTECRVKGRSGFKLKGQNCSHTVFFLQIPNDFGLKLFVAAFFGSQEMSPTLPPVVESPPAAAVNQDPCHRMS